VSREREACIVGAGTSEAFGFSLGKSPLRLQVEAFSGALRDAGWSKDKVDGIATSHGSPQGVDYEQFVLAAGLDTRWASQKWTHGRWAATTVIEAALAVQAGLADCVAVLDTVTSPRGYARELRAIGAAHHREGLRDMGGGHGEWEVHGIDTPGAATALAARRYMDKYGATSDDLAGIAVAFRTHANRNPMAIMHRKAMTRASYFDEPMIVDPFRRADYCLTSEGSACILVTTAERAQEAAKASVAIAGMEGIRTSRDDYVLFARPGLGVGVQGESDDASRWEPRIYGSSGIDRGSVDGLYIYDAFTSNVWMVLERFGFCGLGEAPGYVRERGLGLDAAVPVNTNGGLMSEAHLSGYNHLVEMVRQVRGEAGGRQIKDAKVVQWATPRGDSLIFTKGA
jgi:acetyl-CoA acetyltransferase